MSLPYSKKDLFNIALKCGFVKEFDFNSFENITKIARGGYGTVYRANSTNLEKRVALKSLHENDELFYEKFLRELTNILAVNNHDNIINFYGISIGEREKYINETPIDYIKIYSSAWKNDPNQRPTIENIFDSLKNIKLENIYNEYQDIQLEDNINNLSQASMDVFENIYNEYQDTPLEDNINNQSQASMDAFENIYNEYQDTPLEVNINNQSQASMDVFSRDSISIPSSSTTSNSGNPIIKYNYNDFKNLKNIGKGTFGIIYSATLMNGNINRKVALKSIVVATMDLFFNELKRYSRASSHENIIGFYGISQKDLIMYISQGNREDPIIGTPHDYIKIYQDCWNQFPDQRPNIGKVVQDLECVDLTNILVELTE
ncbi:9601_t:CDS:2 [Diversispora eburnea]|uniref:9601_t:CDS:1 n=1 Tax=Diversispora eburnea TaxID=1213867 RepID=A0A9N9BTX6_9GLOM|nr:9601_t:CDS:2 [Diversispora eburnea]